MGKYKNWGVGAAFGIATGLIFGIPAWIIFQDWIMGLIIGAGAIGFSLDMIFNGSRCE